MKKALSLVCFILGAQSAMALTAPKIILPKNIDGDSKPLVQDLKECRKEVDEVIEWGEDGNKAEAEKLCELRKEHQNAKAAFVKKLQKMVDVTADWTNHGMNVAYQNSAKSAVKVLAECVSATEGMYYPHNIAILTMPEQVRLTCYSWALTLPSLRDPEAE